MPSITRLRRRRCGVLAALAGLVLPLLGAPSSVGAEKPNEPPFFAIKNARLVIGTGEVVEKGTILLANGLISDVGREVSLPPEAWVIDGTGLTVYPGLIDGLGDLGLEKPGPPGGRRQARARPPAGPARPSAPPSRGPEDRPATTSWKSAADEIKTTDQRIEAWRSAGFTSAVTAPDEGIVAGQAAFINLAGERPREMVLETPAALKLSLEPPGGFRSFPGSLFGVIAYIRQVFADADHYQTAWSVYEAHPLGLTRPTYDRTLEPLVQAKAEAWPVLLPAHWRKEIRRAVKFGEELGLHTVVVGAHQGYEATDVLREGNVPVLVSLKWPERSKDADPQADVPLRVLRLWDKAPSTPAALQEAGVRFAFTSDGLKSPKEIFNNLRRALEAGLSTEAALRALTLGAAEIYGLADRLGSLEAGKIANLVLTDGELFEEATKVKMVFVDGRKYTVREPEAPSGPAPGQGEN